ncbi:MAG: adenylyltransferase/cytidyltransferase family protein [Anaerolineae bacterium]
MGQVVSPQTLQKECAELHAQGKTLVFTNGHFDLLHYGHVQYLQQARALGNFLIVGLNSDASARLLKGEGRPITPQEERAAVLAALECVDRVVIFDGPTAEHLVALLKPHVYVKGGDWADTGPSIKPGREQGPPEAKVVQSYGGRVVFLPYLPGHSTSDLIARIRALGQAEPGEKPLERTTHRKGGASPLPGQEPSREVG